MNRRIVLISGAAAAVGGNSARQDPPMPTLAEMQRRFAEQRAQALATLPYERVELAGWADFERLRTSGRGWPVVIGGDEDLGRVAEGYSGFDSRSPTEILGAAKGLQHPRDLLTYRVREERQAAEAFRALGAPTIEGDQAGAAGEDVAERLRGLGLHVDLAPGTHLEVGSEPEVGEWPTEPPWSPGLQVAFDINGDIHPRLHVLLIPTDDGTSVPAYLRWGRWNSCPPAEYHIAALRSWRERYGAELAGLSADVMNLRVARRPTSREEALSLAREQYDYCSDNVDQGSGTLAGHAATLMASDWWYFWWD